MEGGWSFVAAILAVLSVTYLFLIQQFKYWTDKGVLGPKPALIWGNFKDVLWQRKSPGDFMRELYKSNASVPYVGFYIAHKPALLLRDVELIKHVLVKDSHHFIDHYASVNEGKDPLMSRALFLLHGNKWKQMRAQISPVFTSGRLKKMFSLVLECGTDLKNYLAVNAKDCEPVEVKELTAKSFTDIITSCAFGINSNCVADPNAEFREFGRAVFDFTFMRSLANTSMFFLPRFCQLMRFSFFPRTTTDFLRQVISDTIRSREESGTTRNDMIDQLIQLKNKGKMDEDEPEDKAVRGKKMSPTETSQKLDLLGTICSDDLVAHASSFYVAGFETSASAATFALYEMALNPDMQERVRLEVNEVIERHKGQITYEGVQEMKYLDMVLSETLRKYVTLPFLDRVCVQDYTMPGTGLTIEKGTPIFIPLSGLHYDPDFFPDPETFDPERFSEERKTSIVPFTYMPFGEGPRLCIGSRFAIMAVKTTLANVLTKMEVRTNSATPIPLQFDKKGTMITLKGGVPLTFSKIE